MKYIKLKCDGAGCGLEFLIAMNDYYTKWYENEVKEYFICPDCEGMVWTDDECVVEI